MKQYLLSIYQPDGDAPPPEALQKVMRNMGALIGEMKSAGAWVFNAGLYPPGTATVVRTRRDDMLVTDGPFAEGKEHIGGFLVIKAEDLDEALAWGQKLARVVTLEGPNVAGGLPIEVRPMQGDVER